MHFEALPGGRSVEGGGVGVGSVLPCSLIMVINASQVFQIFPCAPYNYFATTPKSLKVMTAFLQLPNIIQAFSLKLPQIFFGI